MSELSLFFRFWRWIRWVISKLSHQAVKILYIDAHKYPKDYDKQSSPRLDEYDYIPEEFTLTIQNTTECEVKIHEAFITLKGVPIAKNTYTELDLVQLSAGGIDKIYTITPMETKEINFRFSQMDGKKIDEDWVKDKRYWRLEHPAWKCLWYLLNNPLKIVLETNLGKFEQKISWAVFTKVYRKI